MCNREYPGGPPQHENWLPHQARIGHRQKHCGRRPFFCAPAEAENRTRIPGPSKNPPPTTEDELDAEEDEQQVAKTPCAGPPQRRSFRAQYFP